MRLKLRICKGKLEIFCKIIYNREMSRWGQSLLIFFTSALVFLTFNNCQNSGELEIKIVGEGKQNSQVAAQKMEITNGLLLWLDAADIQVPDGAAVVNWIDKSGNGNSASQTSLMFAPIFKAGAINGKAAVRFDGNNDQMNISGSKLGLAGAFNAFVVFKSSGASVGYDPGIFGNGIDGHMQITHHRSEFPYFYVGSGFNHVGGALNSLVVALVEVSWNGTNQGASNRLFINGNLSGERTSSEMPAKMDDYKIGIATTYWSGDLAEIILFDRVLSAEEQTILRRYFNDKYGITSNLPSSF